jgi:tRNA threonylcarbamoyladenosine biosynthesis protein TsaB
MRILAVDTTTSGGSAALLEDARLMGEVACESSSTHSARLLRAIDHLLRAADLDIKDIDGFAVAAGPGSFTGIRIGLSTVKSLAFASGRPVAAISTLGALALKLVHPQVRLICPILDAKKGEIYSALFESNQGNMVEIIPQGAYSPDALFARLPSHRVIYFNGSGLSVFRDRLMPYIKDRGRFPSRTAFIAHEVGVLGLEKLKQGRGVSASHLEPIYFRRSQAEEKH